MKKIKQLPPEPPVKPTPVNDPLLESPWLPHAIKVLIFTGALTREAVAKAVRDSEMADKWGI